MSREVPAHASNCDRRTVLTASLAGAIGLAAMSHQRPAPQKTISITAATLRRKTNTQVMAIMRGMPLMAPPQASGADRQRVEVRRARRSVRRSLPRSDGDGRYLAQGLPALGPDHDADVLGLDARGGLRHAASERDCEGVPGYLRGLRERVQEARRASRRLQGLHGKLRRLRCRVQEGDLARSLAPLSAGPWRAKPGASRDLPA